MRFATLLSLAAAAALALTGCEARLGNDAAPAGNGSAEGKAEEGRVSIHAPGFDLKVSIPEGLRREANMEGDNDIIYPNSTFSGMHVEGGRDDSRSDGEVELAFTSPDAADVIARWYQDPARATEFRVATTSREGPAIVIAGTTADNDGQFRVRLSPRAAGGTDGRVILSDRLP